MNYKTKRPRQFRSPQDVIRYANKLANEEEEEYAPKRFLKKLKKNRRRR